MRILVPIRVWSPGFSRPARGGVGMARKVGRDVPIAPPFTRERSEWSAWGRGAIGRSRPTTALIRSSNGFTMVEIAIAVAVIAFALVAIIGILPAGLQVQKENREDTLMAQDGTYFMEAIRNGSVGLDELTNYVEQINVGGTNRPFSTGRGGIGLWE